MIYNGWFDMWNVVTWNNARFFCLFGGKRGGHNESERFEFMKDVLNVRNFEIHWKLFFFSSPIFLPAISRNVKKNKIFLNEMQSRRKIKISFGEKNVEFVCIIFKRLNKNNNHCLWNYFLALEKNFFLSLHYLISIKSKKNNNE